MNIEAKARWPAISERTCKTLACLCVLHAALTCGFMLLRGSVELPEWSGMLFFFGSLGWPAWLVIMPLANRSAVRKTTWAKWSMIIGLLLWIPAGIFCAFLGVFLLWTWVTGYKDC